MKRVHCNLEFCVNCHLCEVYCTLAHSPYNDLVAAFKGGAPPEPARLFVEERRPVSFAVQCRHCEDPYCVTSCLTGALYKEESTGRVLYLQDKCIGCGTCLVACPYGAIKRRIKPDGHFTIVKCDLCPDRTQPACVEACPNLALKYEEREQMNP